MADKQIARAGAPTLFYQDAGDGPAVMLIHGVGADASSWDPIAASLADDFRVLRLDLRGHGRSGHIDGDLTLDDFVRDVMDALDDAGVAKAHIVGFSLGGMIAQALALQHAERVDRLVLLSAVAGRTEQERERVRQRLEILRTEGIAAITGAAQERWFTPEFIARHPELVEARMAQLQQNHAPSYRAAYTVFSLSDLGERLHGIRHRTLVATGEHDQGSNTRMARFMHEQIKGSALHILPRLRHSVLVEAPDNVTALLRGFFAVADRT
jgi:(E)-2-((N-methylformamido)methylene)succinate hydrolase